MAQVASGWGEVVRGLGSSPSEDPEKKSLPVKNDNNNLQT